MIIKALFGTHPLHERLNAIDAHLWVHRQEEPYWCDANGFEVDPPHGVEIFDNCAVIEERTGQTAFYDVGEGANGGWVSLLD